MIENALYLMTCRTAVAVAADYLAAHQFHADRITRQLDELRSKPGLPLHLAANIDSLQTDFSREEKRLKKALQARLAELRYAQVINHAE